MTETDHVLSSALKQCATGDRAAFILIYKQTSGVLLRLARNIVHDDDLAHDILQRGYLKVWQTASRYSDDQGRAFTWILVIMRNQAIDEWRRVNRRSTDQQVCHKLADDRAGPEAATELAMVRKRLNQALCQLPAMTELVIRRKYFGGQSCQEISEDLCVSANTVRSWVRRGLMRLKSQFPSELADFGFSAA